MSKADRCAHSASDAIEAMTDEQWDDVFLYSIGRDEDWRILRWLYENESRRPKYLLVFGIHPELEIQAKIWMPGKVHVYGEVS